MTAGRFSVRRAVFLFAVPVTVLLLFSIPAVERLSLELLFPGRTELVYSRAPLHLLLLEHMALSGMAAGIAAAAGMAVGIFVTRGRGAAFLGVTDTLISLMQTFPPAAVLALAVPVLGFGSKPVVTALILYSVLPVAGNTISGIRNVPVAVRESATAMGMSPAHVLFRVELPIAFPVILAGFRIMSVLIIGTAVIGAAAGAGGLGAPILAGLSRDNPSFIFQGALASALLALSVDRLFTLFDLSRHPHR